jgi:C4-type Zn-finger protein
MIGENRSTRKKACPSDTFSVRNKTRNCKSLLANAYDKTQAIKKITIVITTDKGRLSRIITEIVFNQTLRNKISSNIWKCYQMPKHAVGADISQVSQLLNLLD